MECYIKQGIETNLIKFEDTGKMDKTNFYKYYFNLCTQEIKVDTKFFFYHTLIFTVQYKWNIILYNRNKISYALLDKLSFDFLSPPFLYNTKYAVPTDDYTTNVETRSYVYTTVYDINMVLLQLSTTVVYVYHTMSQRMSNMYLER